MRSIFGVIVAAILVAVASPSWAQSAKSSPGDSPFASIVKDWQEAYNRKDTATIASFYTEDAIQVVPTGVIRGREAIQKSVEAGLNAGGHDLNVNTVAYHVEGNTGWIITEWSYRTRGQDGTVRPVNGFTNVILVQSGNNWKIRVHTEVPAQPPS
jgi:uncharacterized protein (TIGR02246 family)